MAPTMTAVRTAWRDALIGDAVLVSLLGGDRVYHRRTRLPVQVPSVTYFDTVLRPQLVMPELNARVQFDIWALSLDSAELIADRVGELLDVYRAAANGATPFSVPTGEVKLVGLRLTDELDDVAGMEADIARKTLIFRFQAWDLR